jgi:hypothetical protein
MQTRGTRACRAAVSLVTLHVSQRRIEILADDYTPAISPKHRPARLSFHRSQFGDRNPAFGNTVDVPPLHSLQQLRKSRLGLERADLFEVHANQFNRLVARVSRVGLELPILAPIQDSATLRGGRHLLYAGARMKELALTLLHLVVMTAKLCGPGRVRA